MATGRKKWNNQHGGEPRPKGLLPHHPASRRNLREPFRATGRAEVSEYQRPEIRQKPNRIPQVCGELPKALFPARAIRRSPRRTGRIDRSPGWPPRQPQFPESRGGGERSKAPTGRRGARQTRGQRTPGSRRYREPRGSVPSPRSYRSISRARERYPMGLMPGLKIPVTGHDGLGLRKRHPPERSGSFPPSTHT